MQPPGQRLAALGGAAVCGEVARVGLDVGSNGKIEHRPEDCVLGCLAAGRSPASFSKLNMVCPVILYIWSKAIGHEAAVLKVQCLTLGV